MEVKYTKSISIYLLIIWYFRRLADDPRPLKTLNFDLGGQSEEVDFPQIQQTTKPLNLRLFNLDLRGNYDLQQ